MDWTIGIDLGGTKIEVAAVNRSGKILEKLLFPTRVHGDPDATEKAVVKAVRELRSKMHGRPLGVGVGVAAQVAAEDGSVIFAPNLEWSNVPLGRDLQEGLDLPVVVT